MTKIKDDPRIHTRPAPVQVVEEKPVAKKAAPKAIAKRKAAGTKRKA